MKQNFSVMSLLVVLTAIALVLSVYKNLNESTAYASDISIDYADSDDMVYPDDVPYTIEGTTTAQNDLNIVYGN